MLLTGAPVKCLLSKVPLTQGEALETGGANPGLARPNPRTSTTSSQGSQKNVNL